MLPSWSPAHAFVAEEEGIDEAVFRRGNTRRPAATTVTPAKAEVIFLLQQLQFWFRTIAVTVA